MRSFLKKKYLVYLLLTSAILAGFAVGFFVGREQISCEACPPQEINFSLFWEAYYKIKQEFVEPAKFDSQKILYGAISGMVKSLEDPYTIFLNPDDTKKFLEDVSGRFEGVGMEIGIRKGQLQVIAPLEDTPAQRAGLRAGDKILMIEDTVTSDITIDEAVSKIRGPKGTEVVLTVFRDEWKTSQEITIKRAVIEVPSLKWELKQTKNNQTIAYIKLYHFTEKAGLDFNKAAIEVLNSPAEKIVLDLRNNPGGYLEIAQDIAGWFLQKGELVVIEDFGGKAAKKEYRAKGPAKLLDYPIVVLINQGSASGSEILAGALQDNRQAQLIGEKSFGKGSVQQLEKLKGGSALKITIAKWLTPKGNLIADLGLEPDIEIEITEQDYEQEKDPQLDKALEIIENL